MSRFALFLFGSPYIERDGISINVDTRKALALSAYLAVTGQRQSRDTLATLLWPDYDQSHARATLRRTLSTLNKALDGQWLDIDRETVGLDSQANAWIDVAEFQQNLATYRKHNHPPTEICPLCLERLTRAVALYRDNFLAGFNLHDSTNFDNWQFFQADSLRREQAHALERLVNYHSVLADFDTSISYARRWLALDRLHEPAHCCLMQLYASCGQRAMSIHQYQECAQLLLQELGVEPLEATKQLYESIKGNYLPPYPQQSYTPAHQFPPVHALTTAAMPAARNNHSLVGRDEEWVALGKAYKHAGTHGHVVIIEGEAGIGKTRLVEEFLSSSRAKGACTITARCYEDETALEYGPIITMLRVALMQQQDTRWQEKAAAHWLSEVARLLPELEALCPGLPPAPTLDSPGAQSRLFEGIRQVLLALCAHESSTVPGILFFDDIHQADAATRALLSYLMLRLYESPVCLILTWRTRAGTVQSLKFLLSRVQRTRNLTQLSLSRLSQSSVKQLTHEMLSANPPQALVERLYAETEGLPHLLTEYLIALSKGELAGENDEWPLPGDVLNWLASRLTVLGEDCRQILSAAALIGHTFDFDMLCEASGRSEEEIVIALEELSSQGLIQEIQVITEMPGYLRRINEHMLVYAFCHKKLHNLVYEETSTARRRLLRQRIAQALLKQRRGYRDEPALSEKIVPHSLLVLPGAK